MKLIILILALILLISTTSFAYLEPSFRIKALGEDFVGIILDEYTDIFRNPAYLSLVENYKIFGEYRKDVSNRFIFGGVLPKFSFGKIAILSKGWQQERGNVLQGQNFYANPSYILQRIELSEYNDKTSLNNAALFYALNNKLNLKAGISFIYFEDKLKSKSQWSSSSLYFDTPSGFLRQSYNNSGETHSLRVNKFFQISSGLKFIWKGTLHSDIVLTFQHLNSELMNSENRFFQQTDFDSLGNISRTSKNANTRELAGPKQEGNSFGVGLRLSKEVGFAERINFLWEFFYTDWDTKAKSDAAFFQNDTVSLSVNQSFAGDKNNIGVLLKFGLESKNVNKFKLYAGITNSLLWEKQSSPDSLPIKTDSKWRTNIYRLSLPMAIEYYPFNKLTLRYGALPNYTYTRTETISRYNFLWETSTNKTTKFNNSFGLSYQLSKNLNVEGYILEFGNIFTIGNWMLGASYSF